MSSGLPNDTVGGDPPATPDAPDVAPTPPPVATEPDTPADTPAARRPATTAAATSTNGSWASPTNVLLALLAIVILAVGMFYMLDRLGVIPTKSNVATPNPTQGGAQPAGPTTTQSNDQQATPNGSLAGAVSGGALNMRIVHEASTPPPNPAPQVQYERQASVAYRSPATGSRWATGTDRPWIPAEVVPNPNRAREGFVPDVITNPDTGERTNVLRAIPVFRHAGYVDRQVNNGQSNGDPGNADPAEPASPAPVTPSPTQPQEPPTGNGGDPGNADPAEPMQDPPANGGNGDPEA